ncbi:MAG TPA: GntR family transcriptional regulator [Bryobacteraceae bacterium]|nr:GntR family transcriptional regulator [Bryobacteraceae bacterium]
MIPFKVTFEPGVALHEQVAYAARKAMMSGQMRPGDPFPSVRGLSREFKINPNTAHKVVAQLLAEGLIEVRVGMGTVVARLPRSTAAERSRLLRADIEHLVVEAKRLGLRLDDILEALASHWERFEYDETKTQSGRGGRKQQ